MTHKCLKLKVLDSVTELARDGWLSKLSYDNNVVFMTETTKR